MNFKENTGTTIQTAFETYADLIEFRGLRSE
jgi:hypothetical protein